MKLSEAIRLGSMLHPQGFGRLYFQNHEGAIIATCALGSAKNAGYALESLDADDNDGNAYNLNCPACAMVNMTIMKTIIHLNDKHRWTREKIADWVETIEQTVAPIHEQEMVVV